MGNSKADIVIEEEGVSDGIDLKEVVKGFT